MGDHMEPRNLTKFDGTNFLLWKFQMNAVLVASDLLTIVTGAEQEPAADAEAVEKKDWTKRNAKAMYVISTALENTQLEQLITCTTAAAMWTKLSTLYEQKSESNKLLLMTRFHDYRMLPNDSVARHITQIENMARQLRDVGENVSDLTIMAQILGSLPPKFNSLITAWDSVPAADQNIDSLTQRLLKEENRLTATDDVASALAAVKVSDRNKHSDPTKQPPRKKSEVKCFYCKKPGHILKYCRKRKQAQDRRGDGGQSGAHDGSVSGFVATEAANQNSNTEDIWLLDSGASRHMTFRREWLQDFRPTSGNFISLGDNTACEIRGEGTVIISKKLGNEWSPGRLENVLYVPELRKNLFSAGVVTNRGYTVVFDNSQVKILKEDTLAAKGVKRSNQTYSMLFDVPVSEANAANHNSLKLWHERLGHVNCNYIRDLVNLKMVEDIPITDFENFTCEACNLGKQHRRIPKEVISKRTFQPGEMLHSDVCGPMEVPSLSGARFFVNFKDEATGFRLVFFLKHKSDVVLKYKEVDKIIENKFGHPVKILKSDNGREYRNSPMAEYLAKRGTQHETSSPYTPEQNGKAERDMRTIVESARSMLLAKNLPKKLWAEAANTAVYLLNRTPTAQLKGSTPYEKWNGRKPQLGHTRVFGCTAYMHVPKAQCLKFDPKAKKLIFTGYQDESNNYRLLDMNTGRVYISRDVTFDEAGSLASDAGGAIVHLRLDSGARDPVGDDTEDGAAGVGDASREDIFYDVENGEQADAPQDHPDARQDAHRDQPDAQGKREVHATNSRTLRDRGLIKRPSRYDANIVELSDPGTFDEAMTCENSDEWKAAITEELAAHERNGTWTLMQRPPGVAAIGHKWVFKTKRMNQDGQLRYKARLCAKGFLQKEGRDFTEVFSPVVRYDSLRALLAMSAQENLEIGQFDVRTAFLQGDIEETIYMEIPRGLRANSEDLVCRLNKPLYGLKQASRSWNRKIDAFLRELGLRPTEADSCVYYGTIHDEKVYIALYVDDGMIFTTSKTTLNSLLSDLAKAFEITVGDATCFVGMCLERDRRAGTIFIHQTPYIESVLQRFGMSEANPSGTPMSTYPSTKSVPESKSCTDNVPYREAVGSLNFIAVVSRPDIAFAVSVVSRYLANPNEEHWTSVERILRYLAGTTEVGILYTRSSECELKAYSDSDFAADAETRRSMSGYVTILSNGAVTWAAQRQTGVSLSTTEAEYIAASTATREIVWLRRLLSDIAQPCAHATRLLIDNQSTIRLIKNPEFHKRTKHVDVRYHYVREQLKNGTIDPQYVSSSEQLADIFTKPLPKETFRKLSEGLGLCQH